MLARVEPRECDSDARRRSRAIRLRAGRVRYEIGAAADSMQASGHKLRSNIALQLDGADHGDDGGPGRGVVYRNS